MCVYVWNIYGVPYCRPKFVVAEENVVIFLTFNCFSKVLIKPVHANSIVNIMISY